MTYLVQFIEDWLKVRVSSDPVDEVVGFTLTFDDCSGLVRKDPDLFMTLLATRPMSEIELTIVEKNFYSISDKTILNFKLSRSVFFNPLFAVHLWATGLSFLYSHIKFHDTQIIIFPKKEP